MFLASSLENTSKKSLYASGMTLANSSASSVGRGSECRADVGVGWLLMATLNASALSNPDSLTLFLTSDTLPDMVLKSLVDSGSSNSFIDSAFVQTQHLPAY